MAKSLISGRNLVEARGLDRQDRGNEVVDREVSRLAGTGSLIMSNVVLLPFAGLILGVWVGIEVYDHLCTEEILQPSLLKCLALTGSSGLLGLILGYVGMLKLEK